MDALPEKLSKSCRAIPAIISFVFFLFFLSNVGNSTESSASFIQEQEVQLAWSANHGQGEQVYFSRYINNSWTVPVQVSDSVDFVFKPVSSTGNDKNIWVVWSKQNTRGSFLMFCRYSSDWTSPRLIHTGMNNNRAVTVVVDKENTPWIAWTGVDDSYSDVFWSRWSDGGWSKPIKAHAGNKVPDIAPRLALDNHGDVILSWQTYDDGKYITAVRKWDGRQWQEVAGELVKDGKPILLFDRKTVPAIPDFIQEPQKASLFIKNSEGAETIPLNRY